jgi:hypothetical protein
MSDWKEKLKKLKQVKHAGASKEPEEAPPATMPAEPRVQRPQRRDLCIGLDFGTSSTKAVVRLLPSGPAYAVPLGDRTGARDPYLAPTRLWIGPNGELSLTGNGAGHWAEELKVRLMEEPWQSAQATPALSIEARPVDLAAAYLALTLRDLFAWCRKKLLPALGSVELRWSMNVGIPVRDYDAEEIKRAFLTAARAGWHLAREEGSVSIERAAHVVDAADNDAFVPKDIERDMIEVVPEVAAGVASYARSPQRRAGAHLFIDVGATTLDSSMFLLVDSAEGLKYVFLSAEVDSALGALRLHRHRANELGRLALARFVASDPLAPIPQTARDCLPSEAELSQIDAAFEERCVLKLGSVVYRGKQKAPVEVSVHDGEPNGAINVMASGGGAFLPLYQDVIRKAGANAAPGGRQGLRVRPFHVEPIPQASDLQATGLSLERWQRLAIAHGLSYRYEDIGEFVPPSAVSDAPPRRRRDDEDSSYVSKDQV